MSNISIDSGGSCFGSGQAVLFEYIDFIPDIIVGLSLHHPLH
jgi:hypothetical protein